MSKSPSLPVFDEPVYEDDVFDGVLDWQQPAYDNYDKSIYENVQSKLFAHYVPKVIDKVEVELPKTTKGTLMHRFLITSPFCEYTVVNDNYLAKLDPYAPLDKAYMVSYGISTEFRAMLYVAEPKKISKVIIFYLRAVGLGTAAGVRIAEKSHIIGVDFNPNRFERERKFGINEFMNPKDYDKPIPPAYTIIEKLKIGRQIDSGWTYPDWFSQPNPPLYGVQLDIFL
ncbi:alcohol dehydrogenase class-P-like [Dendrobium catenatum]|uniref:alcohol dehydrogenase class-P-like n=1 Tax=Dendrobium catenatum TaxID=906689 RepID=UPI0010A04FBC|nr:alcohol dehydrogenase class-P-like [Dendrobium catenatum]